MRPLSRLAERLAEREKLAGELLVGIMQKDGFEVALTRLEAGGDHLHEVARDLRLGADDPAQ
jgi:hypothetical protein